MSIDRLRIIDNPDPRAIGRTPEEFLQWLGGPAALRISGTDSTRCRAVSVLLHGNEPSGLVALHTLLSSGMVPHVDIVAVVGAVEAAECPPAFSNRMLPGRRDLNRCFAPPYDGADGALAADILKVLRQAQCEALIDVHNNSGHNPAYGVLTRLDSARLRLSALFAARCVHTDLRLGTLIEATEADLPGISIECGRTGDPDADATAIRGLTRFVSLERLDDYELPEMAVFTNPVRICLRHEDSIVFAKTPCDVAPITLRWDVDHHNFETLEPGFHLGWVNGAAELPFTAITSDGVDVAAELFEVRNGQLLMRTRVIPIMMTTDPHIASQDCLCYFVRQKTG